MVSNKIISDGSNEHDLKAVNIATMQEFLGKKDMDDTFESLYNATLDKLYVLLKPQDESVEEDIINEVIEEEISNAKVKKGGRPKKVKEDSNLEGTEGTGAGN